LSEPGTQVIEQTLRISAHPQTVWRYWTDAQRMSEWWGADAQLDPTPGGTCRVEMGGGPVMRGEYLELVPHERIVFSFGWEPTDGAPDVPPGTTRVEITFTADAGDTIMTLRHTGIPTAHTDEHRSGWAHFLPLLADAAARATDWGSRAVSVDVVTEIVIDRPSAEVSAYAADPSNAPSWYANIQSVEWVTSPPARVGSRVSFVARFLGRRLDYTYELAELIPGERLVMRTEQGPFPMETTYTWSPTTDGSTRMGLRNRGRPGGFSKLMTPFMAPAMRRANRKDLANLKSILEST
jgi:uncharacterized protein YndB with AHSA1/START domain